MKNLSVLKIAASLGRLSGKWLKRDYSFRKKAVKRLADKSGFSEKMASAAIDAIFSELTFNKLKILLRTELGNPLYLDGFQKDPVTGRLRRAHGPRLITHVFSANVPNPAVMSFVLGILVKAENAAKLSSEDGGFLALYLESLKKEAPQLAAGQMLLAPRDKKSLEAYFAKSDAVTVYGSDETLSAVKKKVPAHCVFSGYGHRVSFGIFLKEALQKKRLAKLTSSAATDVWMLDQRGCLSPVILYIEESGEAGVRDFCRGLSEALKKRGDGKWLVMPRPISSKFPLYSSGRIVFVSPFKNIQKAYEQLGPVQKYLQCAALEGSTARRRSAAEALSALGVNRITRAGRMQFPPVTWRHDGRPNLSDWLRWTDLE